MFPLAAATESEVCNHLRSLPPVSRGPQVARRKVVLSDLHLGPGTGLGKRFDGLDDFFADDVFVRFVDRLKTQPTELIIAGDFVDFWQVSEALGAPIRATRGSEATSQGEIGEEDSETPITGTDQAEALAALDVVFAAHPLVFDSLREFIAAGDNRLVVIAGNHDGEFVFPRVQMLLAQRLELKERERLVFVANAYVDAGVRVEHGHRLDPANKPAAQTGLATMAGGRCRLLASWGHVFVAKFFNQLEQRYPFVDNLYSENQAMIWGMSAEPDLAQSAETTYRFASMLLSDQSIALNRSALRAIFLNLLGTPDDGSDAAITEKAWAALMMIATDAEFAPIREPLIEAITAQPDVGSALDALGRGIEELDDGLIDRLKKRIASDPMAVAAQRDIDGSRNSNEPIETVVYGHTHVPGGSINQIGDAYYANSGTWTPIAAVSELRARGVSWTELSLDNQQMFARRFPAVVIDYSVAPSTATNPGPQPRAPHITNAK